MGNDEIFNGMKTLASRPRLYLLIAEDDEYFGKKLVRFFENQFSQWHFVKSGQVEMPVIVETRTLEEFYKKLIEFTEAGHLIFATLDMHMPIKSGDDFRDNVSQEIINACLSQKERSGTSEQFGFCVISNDKESVLKAQEQNQSNESGRWNIEVIEKDNISVRINANLTILENVLNSMFQFVLENTGFYTFWEPFKQDMDDVNFHYIHWVGKDLGCLRLIKTIDRLSRKNSVGIYLIFSDSTGYDESWFHLYCQVSGKKPTIIDLRHRNQLEILKNPPEALFINNLHRAHKEYRNIEKELDSHNFFSEYSQNSGCIAFIQFPIIKNIYAIDDLSEPCKPILYKLLSLTLKDNYDEKKRPPEGIYFALPENDRIIPFPSIKRLNELNIYGHTLALLTEKLKDYFFVIILDFETIAVLAKIPWDLSTGILGLQSLVVDTFLDHKSKSKSIIPGAINSSIVRRFYCNQSGFCVRGRAIYDYLRMNHSLSFNIATDEEFESKSAFLGLQSIYEIFLRLEQFINLGQSMTGKDPWVRDIFEEHQYRSIYAVYEFLKHVFISPKCLREKLNSYKNILDHPDCYWSYPGLENINGGNEIDELATSIWPLHHFPLQIDIAQYLRYKKISTRQTLFNRFPDLSQKHKEITAKFSIEKESIQNELIEREKYRKEIENHLRHTPGHPIYAHLGKPENMKPGEKMKYALRATLLYYVHLAIAENAFCDQKYRTIILPEIDLKSQYGPKDMANNASLIKEFVEALKKRNPLGERSSFHYWTENWPSNDDFALYLICFLAKEMSDSAPYAVQPQAILDCISKQLGRDFCIHDEISSFRNKNMSVSLVLDFLVATIEIQSCILPLAYGHHLLDFLNRFLYLVTNQQTQLGIVWSGEKSAVCWSITEKYRGKGPENQVWMLWGNEPLFPINSLKIQPGKGFVWTRVNQNAWYNITKVRREGNNATLSPSHDTKWLEDSEGHYKYTLPPSNISPFAGKKIFICYNRKNGEEVQYIVNYLKSRGFDPRIDKDYSFSGGNWAHDVPNEIAESSVSVICIGSTIGNYQNIEISMLIKRKVMAGMKLIPVILPTCMELPSFRDIGILSGDNYVDMREEGTDPLSMIEKGIQN